MVTLGKFLFLWLFAVFVLDLKLCLRTNTALFFYCSVRMFITVYGFLDYLNKQMIFIKYKIKEHHYSFLDFFKYLLKIPI